MRWFLVTLALLASCRSDEVSDALPPPGVPAWEDTGTRDAPEEDDSASGGGRAAWDHDGDCACVAPTCTGSVNPDCRRVEGGDCDDADPNNAPRLPEVCDGADNDCDGVPDDGLPMLFWWPDADGDGFGSQVAAPTRTCGPAPPGTVANNADCDDLHASVAPFLSEVACDGLDNDCDPSTREGDDRDRDGVDRCFDCDDDDSRRSPAHAEVCNDRDDDCDGRVDDGLDFDRHWRDADGDGYGDPRSSALELCRELPGWVDNDDDCHDGSRWIHPGATEWPCDGIDNDCRGGDRCP